MSPNKLLLSYALRYPVLVISTVVLSFSGALFNGISTALIVPVVLSFLGQDVTNLQGAPPILQKLLSIFDGVPETYRLILMTAAVLLAIILKNVTSYTASLVSTYLSRSLVNGMRLEGLQLLLKVDIDYFYKHKVGDLINQINQEVSRTSNAIRIAIRMFATAINILVYVGILLLISWELTLAATGLLLLVTLSNQYFIKRAKQFGRVLSDKSRAYSSALIELLSGIRLIKSIGNEDYEYKRIELLIREREKAELESQANFSAISPINEVLGIITILAIVALGRIFFNDQLNSLSAILLTYLVIFFRLLPFVGQLNGARSEFANAAPSAEIVADFMRQDNKPFMVKGDFLYTKLKEGIAFKDISFAYPGNKDLVLDQVNLWLPKGTTLALVGASGAGKSTLADLLPRFYDPRQGCIVLDGKDLREYDLRTLRKSMGIVSQDTFLFNNSIRYNIAYGQEDVTDEEVMAAAKRANAYEFIEQLPHKFETEVGDRGVMLSGGQRQRLAIARALLRNPDILVLDEATSALDTVSERLVQQAIEELCRDRTTLVIAHRLSTVQKADQIAVLDKGRVVEVGTHQELLSKGGYYARLYEMQFAEQPEEVPRFTEKFTRASYEIRTHLNSMIGFLQLLVDELVDSPEEQSELIEESYSSAINILKTIDYLENKN
jgi:subfamily B ATP-binding cassette protein MsbA